MEDNIGKETVLTDSDEDIDFTARRKHGKQALRIAESDSEVENDFVLQEQEETNDVIPKPAKQAHQIIDSDSEEGNYEPPKESDEENQVINRNDTESKDSSDDGENNINFSAKRKKKRKKKPNEDQVADEHISKINALCDEDSSSDESVKQVNNTTETKKVRAPQRMSAKQADEQMKLIQSESQRLARESRLSVPYHKPKQHSLKDFLNRRTINRPVPMALTKKAAATIKMSKEELEEYAKSLEDRNKESQEFYRSDSDDSINDDKQTGTEPAIENLECNQDKNESEVTGNVVELTENISAVDGSGEATSVVEESSRTMTAEEVSEAPKVVAESSKDTNVFDSIDQFNADAFIVDEEIRDEINDASNEKVSISTPPENNDGKLETSTNNVNKPTIEIDYNFGENERKTLRDLIPIYTNEKPRLKGPINGVINLDSDDVKSNKTGGDELFERFIKHVVKKPTRSAKEVSILSTENGVVEIKNLTIESEEPTCIHSKPRKDYYKLKEELSLRIAAKRKEELMKKQILCKEFPNEDSDSDFELKSKTKETENCAEVNESDKEENRNNESDEEIESLKGSTMLESEAQVEMDEEEDGDENDDGDHNQEENVEDDEEEDEDDIDCLSNHSNESGNENPKRRKRIIVMDNSDDEENLSSDEKWKSMTSTENLNLTSGSLEENNIGADKTVSQICKNQNLADRLIDSCSKIAPEPTESDNHLSTLFTQTADNISESELLDLCSGSFVTQVENPSCAETITNTQLNNLSDDDFSDDDIGLPNKSRQRKKINISDDEEDNDTQKVLHKDESNTSINDADDNEANENDEENAEEREVAEDIVSDEETEERIVEYDSEENEIEVPLPQKKKISDFFENEAELSESEWGSADEDENNLDKFDIELGDEDEFDQDKLLSELDRIHRRRMLDQDAREVKIIKDTHFEDEEESGFGRQRQYKWKHMENSLAMDENRITDNVDATAKSDDENEETWRRMRHERNNILQETKNQNDSANETKLTITTKTKKRISIVKTPANLNTSATKDLSFLISKIKEDQTHRSSLLIRDEETLANLAKMTTDESIPSVNTNSKNFLFNVIDEEKPSAKRRLDDGNIESEGKSRKVTKRMKKSTLSVLDKLL